MPTYEAIIFPHKNGKYQYHIYRLTEHEGTMYKILIAESSPNNPNTCLLYTSPSPRD